MSLPSVAASLGIPSRDGVADGSVSFSYMADLHKLVDLATAVGKPDVAAAATAKLAALAPEFNSAFYANKTYGSGLQTEQAMPQHRAIMG